MPNINIPFGMGNLPGGLNIAQLIQQATAASLQQAGVAGGGGVGGGGVGGTLGRGGKGGGVVVGTQVKSGGECIVTSVVPTLDR